jgi:cytochrome P450
MAETPSRDPAICAPADFDYYSQAQMRDPYPMYDAFRAACPVARSRSLGGFAFVTTYEGAHRVYSDFQAFSSVNGPGLPRRNVKVYPLDLDPPEQNRFRRLLNGHFSVEAAERQRPRVQQIVDGLIDNVIGAGSCDLAADIVRPTLPLTVVPMLGVPLEDVATFSAWVEYQAKNRVADPAGADAATRSAVDYLKDVVARRRDAADQGDVLSSLLAGDIAGRPLTDDEIAATLFIILVGGLDTTSIAALDALLHLATHPDDAEALTQGRLSWKPAIEEFLRFYCPVTGLGRTVAKDVVLEGVPLETGEFVLAMSAAANRDPARFDYPNQCRLDRTGNDHLTFGNGAHVCLGRHLARVELEVLLQTILRRMPDFAPLAGFEPDYELWQVRSMKSLPVTFTPGRRRSAPAAFQIRDAP